MANQVCEKLLGNIRTSKLNYLVNETPYSAFITIRKRFIKGYADSSNVPFAQNEGSNLEALQIENNSLLLEYKNLPNEVETLKKKNKIIEDSLAGYIDENVAMNQKLFILKGELAILTDSVTKTTILRYLIALLITKIQKYLPSQKT